MRKTILMFAVSALFAGLVYAQSAPEAVDLQKGLESSQETTTLESSTVQTQETWLATPLAMSGASCTQACRDAYLVCLDDCDAWPYPGCYNDCRNGLYACYGTCFGG